MCLQGMCRVVNLNFFVSKKAKNLTLWIILLRSISNWWTLPLETSWLFRLGKLWITNTLGQKCIHDLRHRPGTRILRFIWYYIPKIIMFRKSDFSPQNRLNVEICKFVKIGRQRGGITPILEMPIFENTCYCIPSPIIFHRDRFLLQITNWNEGLMSLSKRKSFTFYLH